MKHIARDQLKAKLERGEAFKLVSALGSWGYQAKRIPGSLHFETPQEALRELNPQEEIVIYCVNELSPASIFAVRLLDSRGYRSVHRYAGGLLDWEAAGYPLEGELVESRQ